MTDLQHLAGLAPVDVRLFGVTDFADGCAAAHVDVADFTGRQTELRERAVLRHELHACACGTGELGTATRTQFNRVHDGADRDVAQRQVVARLDVGRRTGLDAVALLQLVRRDDVTLLTIGEVQQRDAGGAVGVVLDVSDLRRHAVLVRALEVDDAVRTLVATADVTRGDATRGVTATGLRDRGEQRLLRRAARDLDEVGDAGTTTRRRRRLVLTDTHCSVLS